MTKKLNEDDGLEISYRIPSQRDRNEDELVRENQKLFLRSQHLQTWLVVLSVCALLIGWLLGTFKPIPILNQVREAKTLVVKESSKTKIDNIMRIMENYWYFAKGIDNLDERLTDQALVGITTNEEDIHTSYMSREEIEAFTQYINRNFVGIGVQFQSQEDGLHLITRVFRDSPAEKAGVQAGDIIHSVNGEVVDNYTADKIKELVQGEEGTNVTIGLVREGKVISLDITRGQIGHTVDGTITDEGIGYLSIEQFGESTEVELKSYLDEFEEAGVSGLIIDLREDGGGYLEALKGVMSCFLPAGTTIINRDYSDGTKTKTVTGGGMYTSFSPIVLLVNSNTASAAEAFTIAMREQRDDVTVVGTTTYGKGSVQINQYFDDGSALKYTDSIWRSPNGVWVNETGITPDYEVKLHEVLDTTYSSMEEGTVLEEDSVSDFTKEAQLCLDFLGYEPDRADGYFSKKTKAALLAFQKDHELEETGTLDSTMYEALISAVIYAWSSEDKYDTQYQKAVELVQEGTSKTVEEGEPVSAEPLQGNVLLFEADLPDTILKRCHDEEI